MRNGIHEQKTWASDEKLYDILQKITGLLQQVLKREWNRVKDGE
jgi:hypothetical protein